MSLDGRYRLGPLTGRNRADSPRYIGATARAAHRAERTAAVDVELTELDVEVSRTREQLAEVEEELRAAEAARTHAQERIRAAAATRGQAEGELRAAGEALASTADRVRAAQRRLSVLGRPRRSHRGDDRRRLGERSVAAFADELAGQRTEQEALLTARERAVFEDAQLTSVCGQIHDRMRATRDLVATMDKEIRARRLSSGQTVGVAWRADDAATAERKQVHRLLDQDPAHFGPDQLHALRRHFSTEIKAARAAAPQAHGAALVVDAGERLVQGEQPGAGRPRRASGRGDPSTTAGGTGSSCLRAHPALNSRAPGALGGGRGGPRRPRQPGPGAQPRPDWECAGRRWSGNHRPGADVLPREGNAQIPPEVDDAHPEPTAPAAPHARQRAAAGGRLWRDR